MVACVTAVIQARVGSTRLPGKVMYPLNGQPALEHVITRVSEVESVENVVVATSTEPQDDVIDRYAPTFGADVVRGKESDVLSRFDRVTEIYDSDIILRVTGDCPLLSPQFVKTAIEQIQNECADYACAALKRTFPRGLTCEAFTDDSFARVTAGSTDPRHREHVTPYYRENPAEFKLANIESTEVFEPEWLRNRTDLRLTLDEPADYHLLNRVYCEIDYSEILDIRTVVKYIDTNGLREINQHVDQKTIK